jgi:hypothetical protein
LSAPNVSSQLKPSKLSPHLPALLDLVVPQM